MTNVLISEPSACGQMLFLPYVWAVLKSYAERHGELDRAAAWLPPIYRKADAETLLRPYRRARIDVLGLSCYSWNWELQLAIARRVKAAFPDCLVVAGGPDPDYKDPALFTKHPDIDVVVVKDGEIPFTRILQKLYLGQRDLTDVPGLYLPRRGALADWPVPDPTGHVFTGPAQVPTRFEHSPYLLQRRFFEAIARVHGRGVLSALWETTRGCPYGCTFCDWGSSTMSKVRAFDAERVRAEADFLGRVGLRFLFLADANFGILPRDLEIADWINAAYDRHGSPLAMYYSSAKNNPERAIEIARRFHASGIRAFHSLSIQHTDDEVLKCVDRANIPSAKQREVVRALLAEGIPLETQLIVGMPGDTPDRWKTCLATLMEWGIHEEYIVFPFCLLPNAPAAEPAYVERWALRSVERHVAQHQGRRLAASADKVLRSRLLIETRTYRAADWVAMRTYTAFVQALQNCALTRLPATYLRFTHGVAYDRFYRDLIDRHCETSPRLAALKRQVERGYAAVVEQDDGVDDMPLPELGEPLNRVDPSRWLFFHLCRDLDGFCRELAGFLEREHPGAHALGSALDYQRQLVISPDYRPETGKTFAVEHDWPAYFERVRRLGSPEPLPEPPRLHAAWIQIEDGQGDDRGAFEWGNGPAGRLLGWLDRTVLFRHGRANFRHVRLKRGRQLPRPAA